MSTSNERNLFHGIQTTGRGRLASFPSLKLLFPHYCSTTTLDRIDRSTSIIIFISHTWQRSHEKCADWNGNPHPDTVSNEVYQLCVRGISQLLAEYAPAIRYCYIWMDYCCLNQNNCLTPELGEDLIHIIRHSDCLFTPIADERHIRRLSHSYKDYEAKSWISQDMGYIHRAWCRLEMFYAANIPLETTHERSLHFQKQLRMSHQNRVRPHFVYGRSEANQNLPPVTLPPLKNISFTELDPRQGLITHAEDLEVINKYVEKLLPMMEMHEIGWKGELDREGKYTGFGVCTYENGAQYEGEMKGGRFDGQGVLNYATGNTYKG